MRTCEAGSSFSSLYESYAVRPLKSPALPFGPAHAKFLGDRGAFWRGDRLTRAAAKMMVSDGEAPGEPRLSAAILRGTGVVPLTGGLFLLGRGFPVRGSRY